MKKLYTFLTFTLFVFFVILISEKPAFNNANKDSDSVEARKKVFTDALREQIKGKEDLPAESVFSDIQMFKGTPAEKLIIIMDKGFSTSLGVGCGHCHNTSDWASNEKKEKTIAREMMKMSGQIRDLISNIKEIESTTASVTCYTCHRGEVVPVTKSN